MKHTAARPLALLSAVLLVSGVALAACGDDGDPTAKSSDPSSTTAYDGDAAGGDATHLADEPTITAKDFSLTSLTVQPGAEVYLVNTGEKPHTVTADDAGTFDTGTVTPGSEGEFDAPTEPGTYTYHCSIHATMTGTLTVAS